LRKKQFKFGRRAMTSDPKIPTGNLGLKKTHTRLSCKSNVNEHDVDYESSNSKDYSEFVSECLSDCSS